VGGKVTQIAQHLLNELVIDLAMDLPVYEDMPSADIEEILEEIAKLEAEHGFCGLSFSIKNEDDILSLRDTSSYVLSALRATVENIKQFDLLPEFEPLSPDA